MYEATKLCKFCGAKIPKDVVMCTSCGRQIEELKSSIPSQPNIVINNSYNNSLYRDFKFRCNFII